MLHINFPDYQTLRAHGEETYPHECCGVLLGTAAPDGNHVQTTVRAGNTRTDRAHDRYNIAPEELIRIQRQARKLNLDIVGFYHSHPDCPAHWSQTDFNEAHWVGCSYVITRVDQGKTVITNSFLLTGSSEEDKKFLDEPVEIEISNVENGQEKGKA